jgi:AAA15 family ATPase/GTPase
MQKEFEKINKYKSSSNLNSLAFEVITDGFKKYHFKLNDYENSFTPQESELDMFYTTIIYSNSHYINSKDITNKSIINSFDFLQFQDKEKDLNKYINEFDNRIDGFKIIGNKPVCKINGIYRELNEFGNGLKLYIAIIAQIYASENGSLFIDEIENGIHYSQFNKLWKLIFKISKDVNCQIFATTHSKEIISSYNKVQNDLGDTESIFINLEFNKENEIIYSVLDKEMLEYELEQNHEVR